MPPVYVEIEIRCPIDQLWSTTQSPELHRRWDLRFSDIEYLPRPDMSQPQRFLYATRIGFGLRIVGEGESAGTQQSDGSRTSALRFWSDDPKSLILKGSGYWQYIPTAAGTRFLTWYDYTTRFGGIGRLFDTLVFRPLIGWATAWSFDRLRLWLERQIDPATSLRHALIHGISRVVVAFVWVYQGLVPKLLQAANSGESTMLQAAGIAPENVGVVLTAIGLGEIVFGLALLTTRWTRPMFVATALLMVIALITVALRSPAYLAAAFNPVTLNVALIALSGIGILSERDRPSASRCRRRQTVRTA